MAHRAVTTPDLDKFEREMKMYLCALQENVYDRIIQRMSDFALGPRTENGVKHSDKEPPYCSNPGCNKCCLSSDGTTPGYCEGTFFLYCQECSDNINDYRNEAKPIA
jgi:hypothetical protein